MTLVLLLVALASAIGYAIQNVLVAPLYRDIDPLSITGYRGLTLGISMLPVLAFADLSQLRLLLFEPWGLVAAMFLAALGNWCGAKMYAFFPIGVASAVAQAMLVSIVTLIGVFWFREYPTPEVIFCIAVILSASFALAINKTRNSTTFNANWKLGFVYALAFGIFTGSAFVLMVSASRKFGPYLAAYFWELGIGVFGIILALFRERIFKVPFVRINKQLLKSVFLRASPTLIGTGCYSLASNYMPVALLSGIVSSQFVIACILAGKLFGEKLTLRQWSLVAIVFGAILLMKTL